MSDTTAWPGAALALASAVLFGASTPLAKWLLGQGATPQLLAGIFYLGSGIGLSLVQAVRHMSNQSREAPLRRSDVPRLLLAVLLGGALAPALLLLGLTSTDASSASLLLNLEGVATMVIAWMVFKENVDRRLVIGALAIVAGGVLLSWSGGLRVSLGALAVMGACLAWGIDNNVTRTLSAADPVQITLIKGLVAGATNLLLALAFGAGLPAWPVMAVGAAVGFVGYGVSLVLFVRALRHLGAARTSAYYSTAPFLGALLAIAVFGEGLTLKLLLAGLLMAFGLYLHLMERHDHEHSHDELLHEHAHVHDEHHQHGHEGPVQEPHSHWHRHGPMVHKHRHFPDLHHRHGHS